MSIAFALAAAAITPAPVPLAPHVAPGLVTIWTSKALTPDMVRIAHELAAKGVHVSIRSAGSDVAVAGLYTGIADVAVIGRSATPSERQAFEWIRQRPPAEEVLMHGSAGIPAHSPALAILVNRRNPLAALSPDQLMRLFTAPAPQYWRDYGVEGSLAARPIHLHMADATSGTGRFFRDAALGGRNQWAWNRIVEHGQGDSSGRAVAAAIAKDPAALGIGETGTAKGLRIIPLRIGEALVAPTPHEVVTGRYPLSRTIYAYFDRPENTAVRPEIRAFIAQAKSDARRDSDDTE